MVDLYIRVGDGKMKIRNSFVSNSSSSSFIIPNKYDIQEIKDFVKEALIKATKKQIEKIEKEKFYSNWEEYIERLKEDTKPETLNYNINVTTVKEYLDNEWDLSEWYNMEEIQDDDLILYDVDDNFINWVNEEIRDKFEVTQYCLHMG